MGKPKAPATPEPAAPSEGQQATLITPMVMKDLVAFEVRHMLSGEMQLVLIRHERQFAPRTMDSKPISSDLKPIDLACALSIATNELVLGLRAISEAAKAKAEGREPGQSPIPPLWKPGDPL